MLDLFENYKETIAIASGASLFKGFVDNDHILLGALRDVTAQSPFRHMETSGGYRMSVAMTSCGARGWVSDKRGYRYDFIDPETRHHWPEMPAAFLQLAKRTAAEAGYSGFAPDACLINRYEIGAKLSLHQDKDELDLKAPVVSVSLGLPATFLFGGLARNEPKKKLWLEHGDVVVWGGPSRLAYHGILPLKPGLHPLLGNVRINLTFRRTE